MAGNSARLTEMHVSATEAGSYACVGKVFRLSRRRQSGTGGDTQQYVLCESEPLPTDPESRQGTVEFSVVRDPADTTGQNIIRTAELDGTTAYIRLLWDGGNGEQQGYTVESITTDADPNGTAINKYVTEAFTLTSVGSPTAVVAA